jgi:hypothetical protein
MVYREKRLKGGAQSDLRNVGLEPFSVAAITKKLAAKIT